MLVSRAMAVFALLALAGATVHAAAPGEQTFATVEAYVNQAYTNDADIDQAPRTPDQRTLWLNPSARQQLQQVLGHKVGLRVKYWQRGDRTVWVLNEVGKDLPITTGVIVDNNQVADIKVLVYRESRGWEVKHDFFTRQFKDARLTPTMALDRRIDGITGATLSVRAMQRMARAALLLHQYTDANTTITAQASAAGGK